MDAVSSTAQNILLHCRRYPALTVQDLLKFLHQSTFGCGHLVQSGSGLEALYAEAAQASAAAGAVRLEALDGPYFRAHFGLLQDGLRPETLWRCFFLSAQESGGTKEELEARLATALDLARQGHLPFSCEELEAAISLWRSEGFCLRRHSEPYRAAYAPAYRVIHCRFAALMPLLCAIDRKMAQGMPLTVALEGGSAAGKTTAAALLGEIYGCPVFHMDDFFLQPHQRTPERLGEIGGNVDRERFLQEVLLPLHRRERVSFRPYDCHTQSLRPAVEVAPAPLTVVEGAYSTHPDLRPYYSLTAFLRISPDAQRRRIQKRNTPEFQQRFFDTWIPMEQRYFDAFSIPQHCDLILEVDT